MTVAIYVREDERCALVELRQHDKVVGEIDCVLRRFEKGGPPPLVARDLLSKLAATLAESTSADAALSPRELRAARDAAIRGVEGLEHEDVAVQCREAERALAVLSRIFRDQASHAPLREGVQRLPTTQNKTRGRVLRWLLVAFSMLVVGGVAAGVIARLTKVRPRWGTYEGYASGMGGGFKISFVVSPPTVVDGVQHVEITDLAHWHAPCGSRRVWVDQLQSFWTSLRAWNEKSFDFVTANAYGHYAHLSGGPVITEHIHVIEDTGHFTTSTRAAGLFSLSVALYQDGRQIDSCRTGPVQWVANWVAD